MEIRTKPEFRALEADEISALLARNNVGRLAFVTEDGVDIRPLHYVYFDDAIYGRTAPHAKFIQRDFVGERVVFEVDEVEVVFGWRSVLVRGSLSTLAPDGPAAPEWERAARMLQRVTKNAFAPGDPVPERDVVFRIAAEEMTGRASAPFGRGGPPQA
ncbi:MAG: pyridoxamine 5'-phosphate oxidase family protein [Gemmatimonadota bacterium]